jgi:hypothetical protein
VARHRQPAAFLADEAAALPETQVAGRHFPRRIEAHAPETFVVLQSFQPAFLQRLPLFEAAQEKQPELLLRGAHDGHVPQALLYLRSLDEKEIVVRKGAPRRGGEKARPRLGEGGDLLDRDPGAGEDIGWRLSRDLLLEEGVEGLELGQEVASLDRNSLLCQESTEAGGQLGIGHLDTARTRTPAASGAAHHLQSELRRADVFRLRLGGLDETGLEVQADGGPGPKRRSVLRIDPDRQPKGADLPHLGRPGNQTVEDLAAGFRHPAILYAMKKKPLNRCFSIALPPLPLGEEGRGGEGFGGQGLMIAA